MRSPGMAGRTVDHHIMNTHDLRFRHHAHDGNDHGRLTLSVVTRLHVAIQAALAAMRRCLRMGGSTQLGPIPEQVIGRKTGARA